VRRTKKLRKSLSLPRFQPLEDTPLALIADYFHTLEASEAKKLVEEMLLMYFLPRAQYKLADCSQQQLINSYLIARRMAESHFGIMALELGLDAQLYAYLPMPFSQTVIHPNPSHDSAPLTSQKPEPGEPQSDHFSSLIPGEQSTNFMDQLFS
jgi:hypothetical protein